MSSTLTNDHSCWRIGPFLMTIFLSYQLSPLPWLTPKIRIIPVISLIPAIRTRIIHYQRTWLLSITGCYGRRAMCIPLLVHWHFLEWLRSVTYDITFVMQGRLTIDCTPNTRNSPSNAAIPSQLSTCPHSGCLTSFPTFQPPRRSRESGVAEKNDISIDLAMGDPDLSLTGYAAG